MVENQDDSTGGVQDVKEGITALLRYAKVGDSSFTEESESPVNLCKSLLQSLRNLQDSKASHSTEKVTTASEPSTEFIRTNMQGYNNKSNQQGKDESTLTIRDALGNLPSSETSQIAPVLTSLLTDRMDAADLLPATQDVIANEEAMGMTAVTITKLGLVAAQLYAELIGMFGAWGAGLIDVGALSSLSALLRRWCVECSGRELKESKKKEPCNKRKAPHSKKQRSSKRSRKRVVIMDSDEEDGDSDNEYSGINQDEDEKGFDLFEDDQDTSSGSPLSSEELILGGLRLALTLSKIPAQKEFMSWSSDAREALIEAMIVGLATTSALASNSKQHKAASQLARSIVSSITQVLPNCVRVGDIDGNGDLANQEKIHETSVFILRGLHPIMTMQMELPNGQAGKEAANNDAISVLQRFIQSVSEECTKWSNEGKKSTPHSIATPKSVRSVRSTDADRTRLFMDASTPTTGRKERKKRVSFGGNFNDDQPIAPPTLKKSLTTPRRSRSRIQSAQFADQPRPILSAAIGMLQKLATSKGLERAGVRVRTISTLEKCLPHLPAKERAHFLKFLMQLCHSKVSSHRLLGAEVIGSVLCEEWLWTEHASFSGLAPAVFQLNSTPKSASKTPTSRRGSLSPLMECSKENMPLALLTVLHGRLSDKIPAVRARSAFSLADALRQISEGELDLKNLDDSWAVFEESMESIANSILISLRKRAARDDRATVKRGAITALVELLILGESCTFKGNNRLCISETDISILTSLCGDNSVSTRKSAVEAISNLLKKCHYSGHCSDETTVILEHAWSSAVLPLILDPETTCAAKTLEILSSIVIDPLVEVGGNEMNWQDQSEKRRYMTAWRILAHVSENSRREGAARGETGSLKAALKKLLSGSDSANKEMARSLLREIHRVASNTLDNNKDIDSENKLFSDDIEAQRIGVWCLLDAFVDCLNSSGQDFHHISQIAKRSSIDVQFLATSWEIMLELSLSPDTPDHCKAALKGSMQYSLRVLSMLAPLVPAKDALSSLTRLKFLLSSFLLTPDLVGPAISALVSLTKHNDQDWTPSQIQGECSNWIQDLYRSCEESLTSFISNKSNVTSALASEQECRIVRSLFTVGELSMIGFRADEDSASMKRATSDDPIAGIYERPSNLLLNLSQSMLSKYLPKKENDHPEERLTPDAARAHAFTALGKLCLRDESLAKNCLNILARELHQNMDDMSPSVQSNALLVLGDLCVKYTNLVDRYLPVMAACLQSGNSSNDLSTTSAQGSALVRKHGVLMLSTLLLQDYIKWRGLLFHRFLVASADEDEGVAKLAEMTLCGPLLGRYPKLFFNNFVESLFVLNRCSAHPIYAAAASTGDNGAGIAVGFDGINLHGSSGRNSRIQMYKLMLSNMSDEEKIGVTARIAKEILGGALESNGDLGKVCRTPPHALSIIKEANSNLTSRNQRHESAYNVLSDAFAILVSPSLRVGRVGTNNEDEIEESDANKPAQIAVAAKGKLLSKISRKHLIEIVLPILCNLKVILQESSSPLLRDLMRYIVEIFRVYKTEVKEFLASDPTLLQEVEYDARQFQKAQKAETPQRVLAMPIATA